MSGHSKWHQIKHKKAVSDSHKSRLFGRLAKEIVIAAREGRDPAQNPLLREAIARAKKANLPQSNIDRLLAAPAAATTTSSYEGFGPGGAALLIISTTDNPNRTVAHVRAILKNGGGSLGTPGSVQWKFIPTLLYTIPVVSPQEYPRLELQLIEAGAEDIRRTTNELMITAPPHYREAMAHALAPWPSTSKLVYSVTPDNRVKVAPALHQQLDELLQTLLDHDDVDAVYTDAVLE